MSVLLRIYQKCQEIESKSSLALSVFCIRHLGITDKKSFHEFYTSYETWRMQNSKHRERYEEMEKKMKQVNPGRA
jgi:hypothetical protein